MLELQRELGREPGQRGDPVAHQVAAEDDVADQSTDRRVVVGRHRSELFDLAQIVEEDAQHDQVAVELGVVVADLRRQAEHRDHVLE